MDRLVGEYNEAMYRTLDKTIACDTLQTRFLMKLIT